MPMGCERQPLPRSAHALRPTGGLLAARENGGGAPEAPAEMEAGVYDWMYLGFNVFKLFYVPICFVGLAYLDAKAPNLLVAYTLLTVATLPLDAVTLCVLGHQGSFLQWARSTSYVFIAVFKCLTLVGMGMLHTKIKFAVRLRKEPQEEFFGDADKPTARGAEYSA